MSDNDAVVVRLRALERAERPAEKATRFANRLVAIGTNMSARSTLTFEIAAHPEQLAAFSVTGAGDVLRSDLDWILQDVGREVAETDVPAEPASLVGWWVHEVVLDASRPSQLVTDPLQWWPEASPLSTSELVPALRRHGGVVRVALRDCTAVEDDDVVQRATTLLPDDPARRATFVGRPLAVRVLVATPLAVLPAQLVAVLTQTAGTSVRTLGPLDDDAVRSHWERPARAAVPVPGRVAPVLLFAPAIGEEPVVGVDVVEPPARRLPIRHDDATTPSLLLGTGVGTAGTEREARIPAVDLLRHLQVVGQTGTGKSTLLTQTVLEHAALGHGLTLLDPHGTTIDRVLALLPPEDAARTLVVRFGDLENPVPVNPWRTGNPVDAEPAIAELTELLADIFDPRREGIIGPRWERWFMLSLQGAIALLGSRASLASLLTLSNSTQSVTRLAKAIAPRHPDLAAALEAEYGSLRGDEATSLFSWALSKLQRLLATAQLRSALGRGADALDLDQLLAERTVLLIDLGMPVMGASGSRTLGTIVLQKLWGALVARRERSEPHLVLLDEAHLFQHGPLPAMLAEGRKFGVGAVVAHQHQGQLVPDVRSALEANSASLVAFRASPHDAVLLAPRFGESVRSLPRLGVFEALATLSVQGSPTPTFSLRATVPVAAADHVDQTAAIVRRSRERLVDPYRGQREMTGEETRRVLEQGLAPRSAPQPTQRPTQQPTTASAQPGPTATGGSFLDEWLAKRQRMSKEGD